MNAEPFPIPDVLRQRHLQTGLHLTFAQVVFADADCIFEPATLQLGPEESARFSDFKFPKRQNEWLAGRLAAKSAALDFMGYTGSRADYYRQVQIINDADGKPELCLPNNNPDKMPAISISHSKGLAVALAADSSACGIDIQLVTDTLVRVREKFINPRELEILFTGGVTPDSPAYKAILALVWSAKEAIRKKHGHQPLPGFLQISLLSEKDIDGQGKVLNFMVDGDKAVQPVFAFSHHDYSCAYCV